MKSLVYTGATTHHIVINAVFDMRVESWYHLKYVKLDDDRTGWWHQIPVKEREAEDLIREHGLSSINAIQQEPIQKSAFRPRKRFRRPG